MSPIVAPDRCLNPDCEQPALAHGLCRTCYKAARYLIRKGLTSWKRLEAAGRAKPLQRSRGGSPRSQWLLYGKSAPSTCEHQHP